MSGRSLCEDLETEILVRLPAKSLMRFKSVQRSWNLLFKTHTFVTRHKNMHVFEDHHHLMILQSHIYKNCLTTLLSTHDDDPTPKTKPKLAFDRYIFPNNPMVTDSFGHCNGVFCLQEYRLNNRVLLWNPTTREVHVIPPPPSFYPSDNLIGFGADPNTNNFKVVKLNLLSNMLSNSNLLSTEIYSPSTKSWSLIHYHPTLPLVRDRSFQHTKNKYNTLVNGVYHWIMGSKLEGFPSILCFDFSNNQFSILRAPISNSDGVNLAEINGSLAYVVEYEFSLEIWVMDQQGWAKKYSVGPLDRSISIRAFWKKKGKDDGVQVLASSVNGQALTLYNQDGYSVRQFQIGLEEILLGVHEYVPSIAPLSA